MKKQTLNPLSNLSKSDLADLTFEVKETLAFEMPQAQAHKSFTSANLWNIHRKRKSFAQRRFL